MTFDTQPLVVDGHLVESAFEAANQEPRRTKKNQEVVVVDRTPSLNEKVIASR